MNKGILLLFFVFASAVVSAQKSTKADTLQYKTIANIPYRDAKAEKLDAYAVSNCNLDFYYPTNKKNFPILVWFHGGGLSGGEKELPAQLLQQGFAVVTVEYRKTPKVLCATIIDDAAKAVAWAFRNVPKYGGDTTQLFLSGHSAGGYLDLMVGMDKRYLAKYNIDANRIAGLLPLSPQVITHFAIREERKMERTQPLIDEYAPLYFVRKDLPPIVLITGDRELELLGRYEENAYFARMMKLCGHTQTSLFELDGFNHGSMMQPGLLLLVDQMKKLYRK